MRLPWHQVDPVIEWAAVLSRQPEWKWDLRENSGKSFVLWLIADGQGDLISGNDRYELHPGDCIIAPLWLAHHGRHDPANRLVIQWVRFHFSTGSGKPLVPNPLPPKYRRVSRIGFLSDILKRIIDAFDARQSDEAQTWLHAAFMEIGDIDRKNAKVSAQGKPRELQIAIENVADSIRLDPGAHWRVADFSRRLKVTPDYFIRLFASIMGETPGEFIVRTRLDAACNLLHMSGISIGDIAQDLGFCDVHHFSRQFAARMGMNPTAFRNSSFRPG